MNIKSIICGLGLLILCTSQIKAQDAFIQSPNHETLPSQTFKNESLTQNRHSGDFAVGLNLPFNPNKIGVGAKFSYDFTDILRFSCDVDYYFYTKAIRRFNTINSAGVKGEKAWGRMFDINPNLNLVFGDGNFHFNIIGGLYFCYGYHEGANELNTDFGYDEEGYNDTYAIINGEKYYKTEKLIPGIGVGVNLGLGVEYQLTDEIRLSFDQQVSLGLMTSWMAKLGAAYCF